MKMDICGIKIDSSKSTIGRIKLAMSCRTAEALVGEIEKTTGINPLNGLETIEIFSDYTENNQEIFQLDLESILTSIPDRREIVICGNVVALGEYLASARKILLNEEIFYPLDKFYFSHEIAHNFYNMLPHEKRTRILKLYSTLRANLIEKILQGAEPATEACNLLTEYSFLHKLEFEPLDLICFKGYVGQIAKMEKIDSPNKINGRKPALIKAYAIHHDGEEFFAEMFQFYFCYRKELARKNLLEFAGDILRNK